MKNCSIYTNQDSIWAPPKYKCTALLVHQPTHSVLLTVLKYNNNTVQFRLCFVAVSNKMASEQPLEFSVCSWRYLRKYNWWAVTNITLMWSKMKKIRVWSLIKNDHSSYYTAFGDISQKLQGKWRSQTHDSWALWPPSIIFFAIVE